VLASIMHTWQYHVQCRWAAANVLAVDIHCVSRTLQATWPVASVPDFDTATASTRCLLQEKDGTMLWCAIVTNDTRALWEDFLMQNVADWMHPSMSNAAVVYALEEEWLWDSFHGCCRMMLRRRGGHNMIHGGHCGRQQCGANGLVVAVAETEIEACCCCTPLACSKASANVSFTCNDSSHCCSNNCSHSVMVTFWPHPGSRCCCCCTMVAADTDDNTEEEEEDGGSYCHDCSHHCLLH